MAARRRHPRGPEAVQASELVKRLLSITPQATPDTNHALPTFRCLGATTINQFCQWVAGHMWGNAGRRVLVLLHIAVLKPMKKTGCSVSSKANDRVGGIQTIRQTVFGIISISWHDQEHSKGLRELFRVLIAVQSILRNQRGWLARTYRMDSLLRKTFDSCC